MRELSFLFSSPTDRCLDARCYVSDSLKQLPGREKGGVCIPPPQACLVGLSNDEGIILGLRRAGTNLCCSLPAYLWPITSSFCNEWW